MNRVAGVFRFDGFQSTFSNSFFINGRELTWMASVHFFDQPWFQADVIEEWIAFMNTNEKQQKIMIDDVLYTTPTLGERIVAGIKAVWLTEKLCADLLRHRFKKIPVVGFEPTFKD